MFDYTILTRITSTSKYKYGAAYRYSLFQQDDWTTSPYRVFKARKREVIKYFSARNQLSSCARCGNFEHYDFYFIFTKKIALLQPFLNTFAVSSFFFLSLFGSLAHFSLEL